MGVMIVGKGSLMSQGVKGELRLVRDQEMGFKLSKSFRLSKVRCYLRMSFFITSKCFKVYIPMERVKRITDIGIIDF